MEDDASDQMCATARQAGGERDVINVSSRPHPEKDLEVTSLPHVSKLKCKKFHITHETHQSQRGPLTPVTPSTRSTFPDELIVFKHKPLSCNVILNRN